MADLTVRDLPPDRAHGHETGASDGADTPEVDVLGRPENENGGPIASFGRFIARDGSLGGTVGLDLDRPHVVSVVGKRGSGKSYTLGVVAEGLAKTRGVTGIVIDTMGVYAGLEELGALRHTQPQLSPASNPPELWPTMVGLDPTSPAGGLVWRAAAHVDSIQAMRTCIQDSRADEAAVRTADNHLALADSWGCFAANGLDATDLFTPELTVLDCSTIPEPAKVAVVGAVARLLYDHAITTEPARLPWLLVDEAHASYRGAARPALDTLLTRGRQPGLSVALATQRPSALPAVALSQTDLLVAHRLTTTSDIDALAGIHPTYLEGRLGDRLPPRPGNALIVDDTTEAAATVRIRERHTTHGGASPRASERSQPAAARSPGSRSESRKD